MSHDIGEPAIFTMAKRETCASARQIMLIMEASDAVASGLLSGGSEGFNGGNTFSAKCWYMPAALLNSVPASTMSAIYRLLVQLSKLIRMAAINHNCKTYSTLRDYLAFLFMYENILAALVVQS